MSSSSNKFYYSDKYFDGDYEYRHVSIPKELTARVPKARLMDEAEWRALGIQQSLGWQHYMIHKPEPHIILFRRPLTEETKKDLQAERSKLKSFCEEEISGEDIMRQGRRTGIENVDNNRLVNCNALRQ